MLYANSDSIMCLRCKKKERVRIVESVYTRHTPQVDINVCLIECSSCGKISLVERIDDGYSDKGFLQIFPTDSDDRPRLPLPLQSSLIEAQKCLDYSLLLACSIMCRRCLELVCEYFGKTNNRLVDRLREIHAEKVINSELMQWASNVRISGNHAAHKQAFCPTHEETHELFLLTGCIVHFIYCSATAHRRWCPECGNNYLGIEQKHCVVCGHRVQDRT